MGKPCANPAPRRPALSNQRVQLGETPTHRQIRDTSGVLSGGGLSVGRRWVASGARLTHGRSRAQVPPETMHTCGRVWAARSLRRNGVRAKTWRVGFLSGGEYPVS